MLRVALIVWCTLAIALAGCDRQNEPITLEFRLAEQEPAEGLSETVISGQGQTRTFYLHPEVLLDGADILQASVVSEQGRPAVAVWFNAEGGEKLALITGENVGKRLGILVAGELFSAPIIRTRIDASKAIINGDFSAERAQEIATALSQSGSK